MQSEKGKAVVLLLPPCQATGQRLSPSSRCGFDVLLSSDTQQSIHKTKVGQIRVGDTVESSD